MRKIKGLLLITAIMTALALPVFMSGPILADEEAELAFADFNGDGINDNVADDDGDGVPNHAEPGFIQDDGENSGFINFAAGLKTTAVDDALLTNYDRFGKRQFSARGLMENRCGFTSEEGFGSDIGIGIGGSGGACAGGVCR